MNEKELVSIIIPIYNCQLFLKRIIDSILNQTYKNFELILIDDGSTDNSRKILEDLKNRDERINVIYKNNTGVSDTRNVGIEIAKGEYITFFDADDYVEKTFLEDVINIYKIYDVDLVVTGFFSEIEGKNTNGNDKINMRTKLYESFNQIKLDFVKMWDRQMLYNVWNKLYLKSIIDKYNIKFPKYNWGEDVEFNRNYLLHINTIYITENCYYHYIRERIGAVTNRYNEKMFDIRKNEFFEFNNYFDKFGLTKNEYLEFSYRRYLERTLGCVENYFSKSCNLDFIEKYNKIKAIVKDEITRQALKKAKLTSKKTKVMVIPYKLHLVLCTMLMGKILSIIKFRFPKIFNKLKNNR